MSNGLRYRRTLRSKKISSSGSNDAKIRHVLKYGTLAPSTHNTQPWRFEIQGNQVRVFADFTKKIPEADPSGRDLYMSMGALIKNIELACQAYQIPIKIQATAQLAGSEHIATLLFGGLDNAKEPSHPSLLDALVRRQNYRGFFKPEIDQANVSRLLHKITGQGVKTQIIFDKKVLHKLALLTAEGLKMGYAKPSFRREISSYINHNLSRKRHGLHGYSLRMSLPMSIVIPSVMKRKDIGPKLADLNYKSFISAPGVVVLSALDNEKSWFEAGQVLEEINVRLTMVGLTSSIYAAAIEMGDLRQQLSSYVVSPHGYLPQLLFCIGSATKPLPYSVRKDLSSVITRSNA